jgi:hypothetical protein
VAAGCFLGAGFGSWLVFRQQRRSSSRRTRWWSPREDHRRGGSVNICSRPAGDFAAHRFWQASRSRCSRARQPRACVIAWSGFARSPGACERCARCRVPDRGSPGRAMRRRAGRRVAGDGAGSHLISCSPGRRGRCPRDAVRSCRSDVVLGGPGSRRLVARSSGGAVGVAYVDSTPRADMLALPFLLWAAVRSAGEARAALPPS